MADEKKPEDSRPPAAAADDEEKTVLIRRAPPAKPPPPKPPIPPKDEDATVVVSRTPSQPPPPQTPSVDEGEKTVLHRPQKDSPSPKPTPPASPPPATRPAAGPKTAADFEIVCLAGDARGRRFGITGDEALVGSNASCQIVLPGIEGAHVKLKRQGDLFEIHNLGRPGSVIVHGRRIGEAKIKSTDLVKIDEVVVRLVKKGDVFSSSYSGADLAPAGWRRFIDLEFLRANPRYLVIEALGVVIVLMLLWPSPPEKAAPKKHAVAVDATKAKRIDSLLAAGEVLFNAGKLLPPSDHPEAESALGKFNEALVLDPGNEKALAWLKRVDEEGTRLRTAREQKDAEERRERLESEERSRREQREAEERDRAQREEEEQKQAAEQEAERQKSAKALAEKLSRYLVEGDKLFERGQLLEPAGKNALALYREAEKVDPESKEVHERVDRVIQYFVDHGDERRDKDDHWGALENYRKALRATGGEAPQIDERIKETETRLKAGLGGADTLVILYKDETGKLVVVDDLAKVPARYRDRMVQVPPAGQQ